MKIPLVVVLCAISFAQTPQVAFEVVSVKPAPNGTPMELRRGGRVHTQIDDARVDFGAVPMITVLTRAFGVSIDRIKAPEWTVDTRFDIVAKIPAGHTRKDVPEMLRNMLADGFGMQFHHEEKTIPVYELKVGSGKPKMKDSVAGESVAGEHLCVNTGGPHTCSHITMGELAEHLSAMYRGFAAAGDVPLPWMIDRPVIDATGLAGEYDFELGYGPHRGDAPDAPATSAFEAVKALGLKFESSKRTFDYVIIDKIEKTPTEN